MALHLDHAAQASNQTVHAGIQIAGCDATRECRCVARVGIEIINRSQHGSGTAFGRPASPIRTVSRNKPGHDGRVGTVVHFAHTKRRFEVSSDGHDFAVLHQNGGVRQHLAVLNKVNGSRTQDHSVPSGGREKQKCKKTQHVDFPWRLTCRQRFVLLRGYLPPRVHPRRCLPAARHPSNAGGVCRSCGHKSACLQ